VEPVRKGQPGLLKRMKKRSEALDRSLVVTPLFERILRDGGGGHANGGETTPTIKRKISSGALFRGKLEKGKSAG